jgi:hypothetical protein
VYRCWKAFPRRPTDTGVGTVESLRHHVQHHALVRRLSKQFAQIYIIAFKNPRGCYINFLKSLVHSKPPRLDQRWDRGVTLRVVGERELHRSQDPRGHLRCRLSREQGLQGLLDRQRQIWSLAANPCKDHKVRELRWVRGPPDAHVAPRLVSPSQNRTMRRKKSVKH